MAYDQAPMAMNDSTAVLSVPSRLAVAPSLRGSDEVNVKVLESRQQYQNSQYENSLNTSAQLASQSSDNSSEDSMITCQTYAGKRFREQGASFPALAAPEAGPHPKLARLGPQQELQLGQQEQLLQRHQRQQHEQQQERQQQGVEEQEEPMDFSEELLSSRGADFVTGEPPLRPGMGESAEIDFVDFF